MPSSLIYDSFADDLCNGNIDPAADTFYGELVTSYTPNQATDTKRSDVTASETSGSGYTAGGQAVTCTVAKDTANHKETLTFSNPSWSSSSISADGMVIYKHRGGADTADELVCYVDFGGTVTSSSGTFSVTLSSPLTIQN